MLSGVVDVHNKGESMGTKFTDQERTQLRHVLGRMPFLPSVGYVGSDAYLPDVASLIDLLGRLADRLTEHGEQHHKQEAELHQLRADLRAVGRLMALAQGNDKESQ